MLICPACNASNPEDHTFCGYCGSRLERSSLDNYTLPSWLEAEDDKTAGAAASTTIDDRISDNTSADVIPNDAAPAAAQDTLPAWLLEDEQEAAQPTQATQPEQLATDVSYSQPLAAQTNTPQQEQENLTSPPVVASVAAATEPAAWQSNNALPAEAEQGSTADRMDDRPEAYSLPPWLDDATPNDGEADTWQPPDWLASDDTESAEPRASTAADQQGAQNHSGITASEDEALPDWLRAFDTTSGEARPTPPLGIPVATSGQPTSTSDAHTAPDSHTERDSRERDELANWLYAEQPAQSSEAITEHNETTPEHELPDWLREERDAVPSSAQQTPDTNEDELPDWLRDDAPAVAPESSSSGAQELVEWQNDDNDAPMLGSRSTEAASVPHVTTYHHDNSATTTSGTDTPEQTSTSQSGPPSTHALPVMQQADTADTQAASTDEASQSDNVASNQAPLPQWLQEDQKTVTPTPEQLPEEPVLTPEEQAALPEWLRDEANVKPVAQAPKRQTQEDIVSILRASSAPQQSQSGARATTTPGKPEHSASIPASDPQTTASPTEPSKRRNGALLVLMIVLVIIALVALGWWALQAGLI